MLAELPARLVLNAERLNDLLVERGDAAVDVDAAEVRQRIAAFQQQINAGVAQGLLPEGKPFELAEQLLREQRLEERDRDRPAIATLQEVEPAQRGHAIVRS